MCKGVQVLSKLFLISIILILVGKTNHALAAEDETTICKGVFIDEVDVGGMTADEAKKAVDSSVKELSDIKITFQVGEDKVTKELKDLDFTYKADDNVNQALNIGRTGNLIKRYKELKDIEQDKLVFPINFKLDESKLEKLISKEVSKFNVKPKNASVSRENGSLVYTDEESGTKVNVDKTIELANNSIDKDWNRQDIVLDAVVDEDKPKYTREMVEKCDTILGSFDTTYESSAAGRAKNVANGAKLINNTVLYPGEVFSAHDALVPFTIENGYEVAGAYLNGEVVDSVGGGACQVSTTLYNAVLFSELEVVERSPHSMIVTYVDRSRDAALAGDYKDFKFKNSTDTPILIEGYTEGRRITFRIWGDETRDTEKRKIEFVSKDTSHTPPPSSPIIKKDSSKPEGYRKSEQSPHDGYTAELYKVVYENGVEVSRTRVNKSSYKAEAEHITIGTKKVSEEKADNKKKDKKKDKKKAVSSDEVVVTEEDNVTGEDNATGFLDEGNN